MIRYKTGGGGRSPLSRTGRSRHERCGLDAPGDWVNDAAVAEAVAIRRAGEDLGFAIPVLTEWNGEWLAYWRKKGVV